MALTLQPGSDLRARRQALGWSQQELARRADCSVAYVRIVERGFRPADPAGSPVRRRIIDLLTEDDPAGEGEVAEDGREGPIYAG